jgi:electron transport complex protein RnfD
MKFAVNSAPHWLGTLTVPRMMRQVIYAMLPVSVVMTLLLGAGVVLNLLFAVLLCVGLEALMLQLRRQNVAEFALDGSAIVTGMLIALALPPNTPWWVTAVACLFAIVFAKHLYGGLGQNPFNPAMVGYVVVLVSFPAQLAYWPGSLAPSMTLQVTFDIFLNGHPGIAFDALSGATPLDDIKISLAEMRTMDEILARPGYGWLAGRDWQWINLAALAGGLWLLKLKIIRWHIPVAMLATLAVLYLAFYAFQTATQPSPLLGLFSGGTMLAAFFVATDPVSAAATERGKLIYGAGIGALCFAVREWGAYPDGIAFAVLLMNTAAPLIDRYTLPRVYGHRERP